MAISKSLLWQAWPKGFLPMKGASTRHMWTCVAVVDACAYFATIDDTACVWFDQSIENNDSEARRKGHFLPNVNPGDAATWACLRVDLALAVDPTFDPATQIAFWQLGGDGTWCLFIMAIGGRAGSAVPNSHSFPDIDTRDPAEALVLVRIQLREKAAANAD